MEYCINAVHIEIEPIVDLISGEDSLYDINEMARAVFHADYRVYDRVVDGLRTGKYFSANDVLEDATEFAEQVKAHDKKQKKRPER